MARQAHKLSTLNPIDGDGESVNIVIEAVQTEKDGKVEENDRLVAVALASELFADVKKLSDLPSPVASQIEHFFISYNEQDGKKFESKGRHGPRRARLLLETGREQFRKRKRSQA